MDAINSNAAKKTYHHQHGQGIVEFALVFPIFLLLILGVMEAGRLLFMYTSIVSASREGSRYAAAIDNASGVMQFNDCAGIRDAAVRVGSYGGVQTGDVTIAYDHGPTSASFTTYCGGSVGTTNLKVGDRIRVTVSVPYSPMVPIVPLPNYSITFSTMRTLVREVDVAPPFP